MIAVDGKSGQTEKAEYAAEDKPTASALMEKIRQQGFKCALTGRKLDPQTASVDHIVPLSGEGENVMSNIHIVHSDVNQAKGTMSLGDFILMCKQVTEYTQNR